MYEGDDGSTGDSGTASSQADVTSDDAPRSLADEYSLTPLNMQKKYSAQSFDEQVENYFKWLWASAYWFGIWVPNLLEMYMPVFVSQFKALQDEACSKAMKVQTG